MRTVMACGLVLVGVVGASATALGQIAEPPSARVAAMERLAVWVGEWEGEGWVARGPGERHEFRIVESVQPKLGGALLLVQGRGTVPVAGGAGQRVVHDALALLYYDEVAEAYRWHSHTLYGPTPDPEFRLTEAGIEWGYRDEERGLQFRFAIELEKDRWHETGEISLDGGVTWLPMLEMTLCRVSRS